MSMHILVVEDEPTIQTMISTALQLKGFEVTIAGSAEKALTILYEASPDNKPALALVDWMLPGKSGVDFIRLIRDDEVTARLPIIMLTARGEDHDIAAGLDAGADDYIVKPFSPRELISRINALFRRSQNFSKDAKLVCGPLTLDTETYHAAVHDKAISLGRTEFRLLHFLMQNQNKVYSRGQLLDHVWGQNTGIEERTVDVHVLRLRKLLKPLGVAQLIQTVRGAGYRLGPEPASLD